MKTVCEGKKASVFALVTLLGAVWLLANRYSTSSLQASPAPSRKVHLLLLSSWRSGSSFLGEVFDQHPSVFYLMEPAWNVWAKLHGEGAQALRGAVRELLHALFHCDFSLMSAYMYNDELFPHFWKNTRALCSPPVCPQMPKHGVNDKAYCVRKCKPSSTETVRRVCRNHSHVVMKVVRVLELQSLSPLFKDPSLDLRIIHLVRDPRAVKLSREKLGISSNVGLSVLLEQRSVQADEAPYEAMRTVCQSHLTINEEAVVNPLPFLKNRYKRIRYEDIARNPLQEVKGLYEFAGLSMSEQLSKWIYALTHGKDSTSKGVYQVLPQNAIETSQAWRSAMDHSQVQRVQEVCREAMAMFGYRTVNGQEEQQDLSLDLLLPRK